MQGIFRNSVKLHDVNFGASTSIVREVMKVDELNLSFRSKDYLSIEKGDYTIVDGEAFIFTTLPSVKKSNSGEFEYTATLKAESCVLELFLFMFLDQTGGGVTVCSQSEFDIVANVEEIVSLVCRNLNRNVTEQYDYLIDSSVDRQRTYDFAFSNATCLSALESICEQTETEWKIEGRTIRIAKRIERKTDITLSYPDNLLSPLDVREATNEDTCTRMFVFGGERNLPKNYNDGKSTRLLMRGKTEYLQRGGSFIRERVKIYDEIFPRRNSHITNVTKANGFYFVSDNSIDFNINDHLMEGVSAKIEFKSGLCTGQEFEIASYNHSTRTIEIKQKTEGTEIIPSDASYPRSGDEYVLLDITMPQSYVTNAEEELYKKALSDFESFTEEIETSTEVSAIWTDKNGVRIEPYDLVRLYDRQIGIDESIRVQKVQSYPFEMYGSRIEIELTNRKRKTKMQTISGFMSSMTRKVVNNYTTLMNVSETQETQITNIGERTTWMEG